MRTLDTSADPLLTPPHRPLGVGRTCRRRHALSRLPGIATITAIVLAAGAVPASAEAGLIPDPGPVGDGVVFNNPHDENAKKAIENHIIWLIDGAASYSTIRVSTFKYKSPTYTDHLLTAARDRHVTVQVVIDDHPDNRNDAFYRLADGLHELGGSSFAKMCADSCAGPPGVGINHDKFYLFSSTRGATKVIVQSSANMVSDVGVSDWRSWNNAVTLVSEPYIYDAYVTRFSAMSDQVPTPYSSTVGNNAKAYFFPRSEDNTIVGILDNVDCSGKNTSGGWGPDHLTSVHVAMYEINDQAIAKKLWELDHAGCVVHYVRTNVATDDDAIAIMNDCTAHNGITIDTLNDSDGLLHSKYLVIDGYYDGAPNRQLVWTGSYNYTTGALRSNDEALLKVWNHPAIFDAFQANFQAVVKAALDEGNPTVQPGDGPLSPDGGAFACFVPTGEHLRIYDGKADGHHPVAEYSFSFDPGSIHTAANYGGFGSWENLNLDMPEDSSIEFRACNYEGDTRLSCSGWITASARG